MAKQINWTNLTPSESRTLEQLERAGKEVFEAPIEIESSDQLHAMGLTWDQCRTWYFGTKRVTVHLTPSDEQTYRFRLPVAQDDICHGVRIAKGTRQHDDHRSIFLSIGMNYHSAASSDSLSEFLSFQ